MAKRILKPLTTVGLLDEMFDLYKGNFVLFAGISALFNIPSSILTHAVTGKYSHLICIYAMIPVQFAAVAAATWAISQIYLGSEATILGAYVVVLRRALPLVGSLALAYMAIGCGIVFCVVPGVIFIFRYAFVGPVCILEGKAWRSALGRSRELAAGQWGPMLLLGVIVLALDEVLYYAFRILIGVVAVHGISSSAARGILYGLGSGLSSTVIMPIGMITLVLLYYDIRVRNEGFNVQALAKSMATQSSGMAKEAESTKP